MKKILLAVLLVLCLASPGWGERISAEVAVAAYQKGDYATALRQFRFLAESGDAGAQYNVGYMYDTGKGVQASYEEAVKWYRKAAEQGYPHAQNSLGDMYAAGQGVPQDYEEAYKWFALAANQGIATAAQYRDMMAAKLSETRLAEAKRLVATFQPTKR